MNEHNTMKEYIYYLMIFNEQLIKPNGTLPLKPLTYDEYKLLIEVK